jgi:hypothetical protein
MNPAIPIILILVLAAVALYLVNARERRYAERLQDAASALGLRFEKHGPSLAKVPFARLLVRRIWPRRTASYSIRGTLEGVDLWFLEYHQVRSTGHSSHVRKISAVAFPLGGARVPELHMRPERLHDRLFQRLGFPDIDFEHSPEFSNAYAVRGPEEDAIRRLFRPEVLHFFTENRSWSVDTAGDWAVVKRGRRRVKPDEFHQFLTDAARIRGFLVQ